MTTEPRRGTAETTEPRRGTAWTTEPRRGPVVPARARIMGWMLLVLVVVLVAIVLLVRQFLHSDTERNVTAALEQEANEFVTFAETGRDPTTGSLVTTPEELFAGYLQRQYPDAGEALIGVWRDQTGLRRTNQAQPGQIREVADDRTVLQRIVDSPEAYGTVDTAAGPMRWVRVSTVTAPGAEPSWFIGAQFPQAALAETDRTIRTLIIVSAFGVVLAAIASWVVAGATLAPVRQVRQTAAEIGEHDLTQRIPVQGRDDIAALAEQFNSMLDRLQDAFATQRRFVDDAGHELRTPITIVRGHLELLEADPTEREEVVRLCTDELDRMTRIVEDLLVLAKADRPDFVHPAPVSLPELTSDVDAKIRTLGDRTWILEHVGEGEIDVDEQRITQAMLQLAHNAVQHTEPGSRIRFGSAAHLGTATLWITDEGPGVDPSEVEGLFDRFSRGRNRTGTGAGLGLPIVKAIAEAHHGRVRVLSDPGEGATFGLELPTRRPVRDDESEDRP